MCRVTAITIRCAPTRCAARSHQPNDTACSMSFIDGTHPAWTGCRTPSAAGRSRAARRTAPTTRCQARATASTRATSRASGRGTSAAAGSPRSRRSPPASRTGKTLQNRLRDIRRSSWQRQRRTPAPPRRAEVHDQLSVVRRQRQAGRRRAAGERGRRGSCRPPGSASRGTGTRRSRSAPAAGGSGSVGSGSSTDSGRTVQPEVRADRGDGAEASCRRARRTRDGRRRT